MPYLWDEQGEEARGLRNPLAQGGGQRGGGGRRCQHWLHFKKIKKRSGGNKRPRALPHLLSESETMKTKECWYDYVNVNRISCRLGAAPLSLWPVLLANLPFKTNSPGEAALPLLNGIIMIYETFPSSPPLPHPSSPSPTAASIPLRLSQVCPLSGTARPRPWLTKRLQTLLFVLVQSWKKL